MHIAYFDCFSGISGDMCLGALIDAGLRLETLEKELKKIPVTGYRLSVKKIRRGHLIASKVDAVLKAGAASQQAKTWKDIRKIIEDSQLSRLLQKQGMSVFRTLFAAEARVHGRSITSSHLHELGAVDCIVDIFGTIIGLHLLGIDKVYSSAVNLGGGFVRTEHGMLPVPAPATAEILRDIPVYADHVQAELTTPTGAAIIKVLSSGHGGIPQMRIEKTGIGAGGHDFGAWPNVLRIFIGTPSSPLPTDNRTVVSEDTITVIETNIDDMNPQIYEHLLDVLFKAGCLDAYLTQVIMKKGRPAVKLTVLCDNVRREALAKIILTETSSIGLRYYEAARRVMERETKILNTKFGKVRFKRARLGNEIIKSSPEYEDCRKIARQLDLPLIEVMKRMLNAESP